ncbi:MAG: hypothetical protein Q8O84_04585, partial [Nanoarchaeota archaeon]|nr:hypothetical protein [Nanoarchaeota archaeon]
MKKSLLIFVFVLLFIPLVFSIQIDTDSELAQGETLVVKLSGNFYKPILENNIYFYRNTYTAVPLEFELLKIEGDYYISASTLSKTPGNYSLVIKNSEYSIAGGQRSSDDIKINFTILDEFADFSAKPGIQILESSRNPFYLEIQNLKDNQIIVSVNKNPNLEQKETGGFFESLFGSNEDTSAENQFIFKANEKKQVELEFENLTEIGLRTIKLSSENFTQNVFVYVLSAEEKLETEKIYFEQKFFNISMAVNSETERILYLKNSGAKDFENVTLLIPDSLKEYFSIYPDFFEFFESNETQKIILNISSKSNSETLSGAIKAQTSDNAFAYVDISLEIIEGFVPENGVVNQSELPKITKSCSEINGTICSKSQKCSGEKVIANDGECCLSKCDEKKKSPAGKIIGWIIVIILVALYVWFYLSKYKKTRSKVNLLEIAEGK